MNSLGRVSLTLNHKPADRIPVYPLINSVSRKILGISYDEWSNNVDKCAEAIIKTTDALDIDVITTLVDLSVEAADWGQEILFFEDKAGCPSKNKLIQTPEDYAKIKEIDPRKTKRMAEHIELCKKLVVAKGNEKPIVAFLFAPLGILSMMRGMDNLMVDLIMEPDKVKPALEEIKKTLITLCDAVIDTGVHAIMFDTLFASKTIMKEKMWDKFEGVYMEEIANHVKSRGCMLMIHNCGKGPYFDAQIKRMDPIAFSFLHYPNNCNSFEEMAEKYGDKLCLIGHVDPGWLMSATEEETREESIKEINVFKNTNSFILATGCEYPAPLDFTKAEIMVECVKTYGVYEKVEEDCCETKIA